jgi:hypothetical protein
MNAAAQRLGPVKATFIRTGTGRGPVTITMADGEVLTGEYRVADQSKERSVISQVRPEPTEDGIIAERIAPNLDAFSRMIAKIAYCHAIITVGMDGFISLVPSYLKKNNLNLGANYFVGTRMPVTHETEQRGDHHVEIRYERIRGIQTVVANIRLFASWGAPTYHVYLGPATQASWVNAP